MLNFVEIGRKISDLWPKQKSRFFKQFEKNWVFLSLKNQIPWYPANFCGIQNCTINAILQNFKVRELIRKCRFSSNIIFLSTNFLNNPIHFICFQRATRLDTF